MTEHQHEKKYHKIVLIFDRISEGIWGICLLLIMEINCKPRGKGINMFGSVAGRIKKSSFDPLGHHGENENHSVIFIIYNCCRNCFANVYNTCYSYWTLALYCIFSVLIQKFWLIIQKYKTKKIKINKKLSAKFENQIYACCNTNFKLRTKKGRRLNTAKKSNTMR